MTISTIEFIQILEEHKVDEQREIGLIKWLEAFTKAHNIRLHSHSASINNQSQFIDFLQTLQTKSSFLFISESSAFKESISQVLINNRYFFTNQVVSQLKVLFQCLEKETTPEELAQWGKLLEFYNYAYNSEGIEVEIGKLLLDKAQTLSTAESCTGGLVANQITNVAGCSQYFMGGIVAYSNDMKMKHLGVKQETLNQYGAVSEQTAIEMAQGARKASETDIGISTTGIAGPSGGTPNKPVGTIWIGYADNENAFAKLLQVSNDRLLNIKYTATAILNLLKQELLNR